MASLQGEPLAATDKAALVKQEVRRLTPSFGEQVGTSNENVTSENGTSTSTNIITLRVLSADVSKLDYVCKAQGTF